MPASFYLYLTRNRWASYLVWPGFIWMGMLLILPTWLLCMDTVRWAYALAEQAANPERHTLVLRILAGAAAVLSGLTGGVALSEGLGVPQIREVHVPLSRLPAALDGTTIVHLTDVHIGPTIGRGFIEGLVERSNALAPDVVVITGDLVDGRVRDLERSVAPLRDLNARWGVYFVTGNHEYYSGVNEWIAHLATLGVIALRNERVSIGEAPHTFDLAGIDDSTGRSYPGHGPDLARALSGRDPTRELVLLAHQPKAVTEAARHGVGLQLSGHTHGGQIWPFTWAVRLFQPYVAGLAKLQDTTLYVSRGSGYWGPPMRLAAPAEIALITLHSVGPA
jgi:predicted MPP superfamily phosphohydrolase